MERRREIRRGQLVGRAGSEQVFYMRNMALTGIDALGAALSGDETMVAHTLRDRTTG